MVYEEELLEALAAVPAEPWHGTVYRHMFLEYPPDKENTSGARWNPPDVPAIYTSLDRATVIAEGEHAVSSQPVRLHVKRTLYKLRVGLASVIDVRPLDRLKTLGLDASDLHDDDHRACQRIGGATERLGHDGMLVPSARSDGSNLVIFPNHRSPDAEWEVAAAEVIHDPAAP